MALIDRLAGWWEVNDPPPTKFDMIALVSIGATKSRLTKGAVVTVDKTLELLEISSSRTPIIAFGAFTGNEVDGVEEAKKYEAFKDHPFLISVGKVLSTITECLAFKEAWPHAKRIIFVTEQAHSRRAKIIWNCLWPEAEIYVVSVKLTETVDKDSPMWPYRNALAAFLFQALPTPLYKVLAWLGPNAMTKFGGFHQPIKKG